MTILLPFNERGNVDIKMANVPGSRVPSRMDFFRRK